MAQAQRCGGGAVAGSWFSFVLLIEDRPLHDVDGERGDDRGRRQPRARPRSSPPAPAPGCRSRRRTRPDSGASCWPMSACRRTCGPCWRSPPGIAGADAGIVRPTFVVADGGEPAAGRARRAGPPGDRRPRPRRRARGAPRPVGHRRLAARRRQPLGDADRRAGDVAVVAAGACSAPASTRWWLPRPCPSPSCAPARERQPGRRWPSRRPRPSGRAAPACWLRRWRRAWRRAGWSSSSWRAMRPATIWLALLGRAAAGVIVENPVAWLEREGSGDGRRDRPRWAQRGDGHRPGHPPGGRRRGDGRGGGRSRSR